MKIGDKVFIKIAFAGPEIGSYSPKQVIPVTAKNILWCDQWVRGGLAGIVEPFLETKAIDTGIQGDKKPNENLDILPADGSILSEDGRVNTGTRGKSILRRDVQPG